MIKVYWVAVFDQARHVPSPVSSGYDLPNPFSHLPWVPHLPLCVVEKVLVQLPICQCDDDAGGAITCRHRDSISSFQANNLVSHCCCFLRGNYAKPNRLVWLRNFAPFDLSGKGRQAQNPLSFEGVIWLFFGLCKGLMFFWNISDCRLFKSAWV